MVLALIGIAFEMTARARMTGALRAEIANLKAAQAKVETELAQAKSGMLAIQEALQHSGGAQKQRMAAMADEVAVLQKLVARLEAAAAAGAATSRPLRLARTASGMTDAQVLELVRSAVSDGAIDLHLQPVVDLPQRRKRYYDASAACRTSTAACSPPKPMSAPPRPPA